MFKKQDSFINITDGVPPLFLMEKPINFNIENNINIKLIAIIIK